MCPSCESLLFFFFQAEDGIRDLTVTGVQTCALPISFSVSLCPCLCISPILSLSLCLSLSVSVRLSLSCAYTHTHTYTQSHTPHSHIHQDRKSTRLNSSHSQISYAVFCLKKKKQYTFYNLLLASASSLTSRASPSCLPARSVRTGLPTPVSNIISFLVEAAFAPVMQPTPH